MTVGLGYTSGGGTISGTTKLKWKEKPTDDEEALLEKIDDKELSDDSA